MNNWKLLKELAETHGLTMSNPMPGLYNVNRGEGNMLFNGSAKECYAYLRGYGESKPAKHNLEHLQLPEPIVGHLKPKENKP